MFESILAPPPRIEGAARLDSVESASLFEAPDSVRPAGAVTGDTHVLYINRDCDDVRRASIERGLSQVGMPAERIRGVEGLKVPSNLRDMFFDGDKLHSRLRPGEVGCYASHLRALGRVIERKLHHALILEDDAVLPHDLQQIIARILDNLPPTWDIIHLCRNPSRAVKPVAHLTCGRKIVRYSRIPETTTGYLVSRTGAEKFLAPVKRYWPVDTDFRQPWRFGLDIYGVTPSVVAADDTFSSSIHLLGDHSRLRRGLPKPSLHCWTGNPLHTFGGLVFNLKKLGMNSWTVCFLRNTFRRTRSLPIVRPLLRRRSIAASAPRSA